MQPETEVLYKMINRIIIRIKTLQIIYAYYQNDSGDIKSAGNEILKSLQKSYDLYHYLLLLIPMLTDAEQKRIDKHKHKYLVTESELNPNLRLTNNRFSEQLSCNKQLQNFSNAKGTLWNDDDSNFVWHLLNEILHSEIYENYLNEDDTYESDKEFWYKVFKKIIWPNEELNDMLEDKSIYWEDDLGIIGTFVLKTIKRFTLETDSTHALLPMFKDEEDRTFALELLHHSIVEGEDNNQRITKQISNWDIERIALIDLYIMQIALAEIRNFPSIPLSVSLNEYIDLARYYSTPKSSNFINGILDAIVQDLKKEGLLFKD